MDFAMCAPFLEADVWESRLRAAVVSQTIEITECNSVLTLLHVLELKSFSLMAIILNGLEGLEAVRVIRQHQPEIPLLWISDEDFSLFGYQYHVTHFLRKPVRDVALREALKNCLRLSAGLSPKGFVDVCQSRL